MQTIGSNLSKLASFFAVRSNTSVCVTSISSFTDYITCLINLDPMSLKGDTDPTTDATTELPPILDSSCEEFESDRDHPWFVTAADDDYAANDDDESPGNFICQTCRVTINRNCAVYFMDDRCFCSNNCRISYVQ